MENGMTALTTISHGDALTLSSLEIAGLTGRAHRNVMRDIRSMLNALKIEPVGGETRFGSTYLDAKGQVRECFNLPKHERMDEIGSRPFHEWTPAELRGGLAGLPAGGSGNQDQVWALLRGPEVPR
ncbi:hypothetical protein Nham_0368 [Nitrobacter hamburgensis X14]|uniref:Rha family transcriptional regulator n=1 Tax=Nitrobacter hamburgensis (strain DSM 10229 / NCIMB 13809 / X14) TaxID=323097 RepID=Q1QR83_NITHX|nr:Rha family transcriptional regulator [Nitrobacter hamburgensis]ABE61264.1 hypothetical protein Nham_0368 [Nitrobacter hamburgensis X14]